MIRIHPDGVGNVESDWAWLQTLCVIIIVSMCLSVWVCMQVLLSRKNIELTLCINSIYKESWFHSLSRILILSLSLSLSLFLSPFTFLVFLQTFFLAQIHRNISLISFRRCLSISSFMLRGFVGIGCESRVNNWSGKNYRFSTAFSV